jgi:hypothetical protein
MALTAVGGLHAHGTTAFEAADATLDPLVFVAVTVKV